MIRLRTYSRVTWAEDTALLRSNRSAVPGAETEARTTATAAVVLAVSPRTWPESDKPSRHDAAKSLAGRLSQLANSNPTKFRLPVNQDRMALFLHGYRRFTEDVDLLVTANGLRQIHRELNGHGYW